MQEIRRVQPQCAQNLVYQFQIQTKDYSYQNNFKWLLHTLSTIHQYDLKKPDWRKLFTINLKRSLESSNRQTCLFYYKAVKLYSNQKDENLITLIQSLKYTYNKYSYNKQDNLILQDYMLAYNTKLFSQKKLLLLNKTIHQILSFFSLQKIDHSQVFIYYSNIFKKNKIKQGLSYTIQTYMKLIRRNQIKFPLLNIYKMMFAFFQLYQQQFSIQYQRSQILQNKSAFKENISLYTINLAQQLNIELKSIYKDTHTPIKLSNVKSLSIKSVVKSALKNPIQSQQNKSKSFIRVIYEFLLLFQKNQLFQQINKNILIYQNGMMQIFISRVLAILSVVDKEDTNSICKQLLKSILRYGYNDLFSEIIVLQGFLLQSTTYLGLFKYIVSLDYFFMREEFIKNQYIKDILEETIILFKDIIKYNKIQGFISIIQIFLRKLWNKYTKQLHLIFKQIVHNFCISKPSHTSQQSTYKLILKWQPYLTFFIQLIKISQNKRIQIDFTFLKMSFNAIIYYYKKNKQYGRYIIQYMKESLLQNNQNIARKLQQFYILMLLFNMNSIYKDVGQTYYLCSTVLFKKNIKDDIDCIQYYHRFFSHTAHFINWALNNNRTYAQSSGQFKEQYNFIYAARINGIMLDRFCKIFTNLAKQTQRKWHKAFYYGIDVLIMLYPYIETQLTFSIYQSINSIKDNILFLQIIKTLKDRIYQTLKYTLFEQSYKQFQLLNSLQIYVHIMRNKQQYNHQLKLDTIDFCFNLKLDLFAISNRIQLTQINKNNNIKFIEQIIDRIDVIQMQILQNTISNFLGELYQQILRQQIKKIDIIVNVSLKLVYHIFYHKKMTYENYITEFNKGGNHDATIQSQKQKQYKMDDCLQYVASQMHQMKHKCLPLYNIFINMASKDSIIFIIGEYSIYKLDWSYILNNQIFCSQLNDLIYIAHLCDMSQLQNILISLRLSFIYQQYQYEIFLLELSKYYFILQFKQSNNPTSIFNYIQDNLDKISKNSIYYYAIKLMAFGQYIHDKNFSLQHNIYKAIYLIQSNHIDILQSITDCINLVAGYLLQTRCRIRSQREHMILKPTRNIKVGKIKIDQFWINSSMQEGWFCTKLLIMMMKNYFKAIIKYHQLSKIKSILEFSLFFIINTAHLIQLYTPLQFYMLKKQTPNIITFIDNLKQLKKQQLSSKVQYKQIEQMVLNKRKSLCFGFQQSNQQDRCHKISKIFKKIDNCFMGCGKIGELLGMLYCDEISKQLNVTQYTTYKAKSAMAIFSHTQFQKDLTLTQLLHSQAQIRNLQQQISFIDKLTSTICYQITDNYQKVLIIKQYISEFINDIFDQEYINELVPQQHRKIDQIIAVLALCFEEYHYQIKQYIYTTPNIAIANCDFNHIYQQIQRHKGQFIIFRRQFQQHIYQALQFLKKQSLYAITLVFPLGDHVFMLSFKESLLVTFSDRYDFQDHLQLFSKLIGDSDQLHHKKPFVQDRNRLHQVRQGIDRQLGRITQKTNLGIADINPCHLYNKLLQLKSEHASLDINILKFYLTKVHITQYNKQKRPKSQQILKQNFIEQHYNIYCKRYKINLSYNEMLQTLNLYYKTNLKSKRNQQINKEDENLLLYIHYKYIQYNYEHIKCMRIDRGVYRLPSILYLMLNQQKNKRQKVYSLNNCKYLVNSKNDLVSTQKLFQNIKSKFQNWIGIKGRIPSSKEINCLLNKDVYLYMGHGSGFQTIDKEELQFLQPKSLMMIFGCASARVIFDKSQPCGEVYRFLMKSCPCYLGCMWTVTDIDIDMLTEYIFLKSQETNLSLMLQQSRKKCKLTFPCINSGSIVIYGLPIYINR